jgi:hypothetical protein
VGGAAEMDCDRELVRNDDGWEIRTVEDA